MILITKCFKIFRMILKKMNILLADDDTDDCNFFDKVLSEIPILTQLEFVHDGEELMNYLSENTENLPDVIFLDLSMPRKNGFECLSEMKEDKMLKDIPVVMFSTSFPQDISYEQNMVNMLLKIGAHGYIRKSGDFNKLKLVIHNTLIEVRENKSTDESAEIFDLPVQNVKNLFE
jgi:CheY-like chemotaxis protein